MSFFHSIFFPFAHTHFQVLLPFLPLPPACCMHPASVLMSPASVSTSPSVSMSQTGVVTPEVPDHVTKSGLSRHVIRHMTKCLIRCLDHLITNQMTKSASTHSCMPTSIGMTCVMSMTDTRARHLSKSSKIGSVLTQVWVNASWVYPEIQYAHMGTSE